MLPTFSVIRVSRIVHWQLSEEGDLLKGERCIRRNDLIDNTHYSIVEERVKIAHGVYSTTKMSAIMDQRVC